MIERFRAFVRRHWPALRLRTLILAVLLFAAAMPGAGAVFLRVYENTMVRRTEAEMVAQSAALAAAAEAQWPGADPSLDIPPREDPGYFTMESTRIDLRGDRVFPERPPPSGVDPSRIDAEADRVAAWFGPVLEETTRTTLAAIVFLDRHGRVVNGLERGADYSQLPEVQRMLAGDTETVLRKNAAYQATYRLEWLSRASSLRIHYTRPIVVNGDVVGGLLLSRSPRALFRGIYEDRGKIALGAAIIFGVLLLLAGVVSRGVTRPIEALSQASREVADGRGGDIPDTPQTAAVEIRQLYEDFRGMAEAIATRSRYLKDFASALSHEFKTPLAGIAGAVEILEDHFETMSDEERRRFLANISADTARLSQLVRRLLDLARADMAVPETDVAADLQGVVRRLADAMSLQGFSVRADLQAALPKVAVPEETLETVLTAVIENSRQAGARKVEIRSRRVEGKVVLSVTDDGPGIPPADFAKVFEPFFTSHRADGGSGLGLPIARSLLAASKAEIALVKSEAGARFDIRLPIAHAALFPARHDHKAGKRPAKGASSMEVSET